MIVDAAIVVLLSFAFERQGLFSTWSHLWLLAVIMFLYGGSVGLSLPIHALAIR